jgi:hypothetical protein
MARNQLGFHSGALHDLQQAQLLDPTDKKILVEIRKVENFHSKPIRTLNVFYLFLRNHLEG